MALGPYLDETITQQEFMDRAAQPIKKFMSSFTREKDLAMFVRIAKLERPKNLEDIPIWVMIPAFVIFVSLRFNTFTLSSNLIGSRPSSLRSLPDNWNSTLRPPSIVGDMMPPFFSSSLMALVALACIPKDNKINGAIKIKYFMLSV